MLFRSKNFSFTNEKTGRVLIAYHIGLNLMAVMLLVRGVAQVLAPTIPSGMSAVISGIAGIGHILLGVSTVMLLVQIKSNVLA